MLLAFALHWDEAGMPAKVALLEAAGARVLGSEALDGKRAAAKVKDLKPDLLVVWAHPLPGHGRVTAAAIRSYPWGRDLPVLVVHGDPDLLDAAKKAKLEEVLPDAILVTPRTLPAWLEKVEKALEGRRKPALARTPEPGRPAGAKP